MRKIVIVLWPVTIAFSSNAQSSKVVSAYRHMEDYKSTNDPESLKRAKEAIDLASENPDTKEQAKTHIYKGQIYFALYDAQKRAEEEKLLKTVADPNKRAVDAIQNTPTADLETSSKAYIKARELDVKGNYTSELKAIGNISIYFDNVGRVNYNSKKYDAALNAFENVFAISGNTDTVALAYAAMSADLSKNYPKAKIYYQRMADRKQGRGNTYSSLMNVYLMMNDTTGGMEVLKKGRTAFPNDINLLISETNFFLKTNNSPEALNNLNLAIQAKPSDFNLYLVRGNIYDNLANPKDAANKDLPKPVDYEEKMKLAESDYKKAIELKPDYFDALYNLGVLYNNRGVSINKQADEITDTKKYNTENAKAVTEYTKAMPVLEKALEVNPKDRATMIALKQIYARLQQTDKLNAIMERLKN